MSAQATQLAFFALLLVAFYFLMIRPQQKRQKERTTMMSALSPGAEILTIGGIYGTVVSIGENKIRIRVADGSELEIAKAAVGSVVTPPSTPIEDEAGSNE